MAEVYLCVTCNADTEEGAEVNFKIFKEGSDPKRDKPTAELQAFNKDGKARVPWEPVDPRNLDDKTPLKFFYTADMWRAKTVQSELITIKHPKILGIKWEPEFIYQGGKAKLILTTFEMANLNWKVKIQFWLRGKIKSKEPVYEFAQDGKSIFSEGKSFADKNTDEAPLGQVQAGKDVELIFWENGRPDPYIMLDEQEITIDRDDLEVIFDTSSVTDRVPKGTGDYDVETQIVSTVNKVTLKGYLRVGVGSGEE
jgi:hypothetical protein